jgi:hypothetical protein
MLLRFQMCAAGRVGERRERKKAFKDKTIPPASSSCPIAPGYIGADCEYFSSLFRGDRWRWWAPHKCPIVCQGVMKHKNRAAWLSCRPVALHPHTHTLAEQNIHSLIVISAIRGWLTTGFHFLSLWQTTWFSWSLIRQSSYLWKTICFYLTGIKVSISIFPWLLLGTFLTSLEFIEHQQFIYTYHYVP